VGVIESKKTSPPRRGALGEGFFVTFLSDAIVRASSALSLAIVNHTLLRSPSFHVLHARAATEFRFVDAL
jgi:hypothetical protein